MATKRSEDTTPAEDQARETAPAQSGAGPREPGLDRGRDITNEQLVGAVHRVPGAAVETQADREAMESYLAEDRADPEVPLAKEYEGIDTTSPERNVQTRSNIVSDGPGTTGYVGSRSGPGSDVPAEDLPLSAPRAAVERGDVDPVAAGVNPVSDEGRGAVDHDDDEDEK